MRLCPKLCPLFLIAPSLALLARLLLRIILSRSVAYSVREAIFVAPSQHRVIDTRCQPPDFRLGSNSADALSSSSPVVHVR